MYNIKQKEDFKTGLHDKSKRIFHTYMQMTDNELY